MGRLYSVIAILFFALGTLWLASPGALASNAAHAHLLNTPHCDRHMVQEHGVEDICVLQCFSKRLSSSGFSIITGKSDYSPELSVSGDYVAVSYEQPIVVYISLASPFSASMCSDQVYIRTKRIRI